MNIRHKIHIIDLDEWRRATLARLAFAAGMHAEIYADFGEFFSHRPRNGIAFVQDDSSPYTAIDCINAMDDLNAWIPVVALSEKPVTDRVVATMKAGAYHYMRTPTAIVQIEAVVNDVSLQSTSLRQIRARTSSARRLIDQLSASEREVLDRMALGFSNKAIGRELDISPRTVEIHRMKMMHKIGAKHTADAIRLRLEAGGHLAA